MVYVCVVGEGYAMMCGGGCGWVVVCGGCVMMCGDVCRGGVVVCGGCIMMCGDARVCGVWRMCYDG